ncbi:MAG: hypothetical protein KAH48_04270 [Chlorobi bacterium]|nr:hypothetical protein [Chlorobiota bacterium]
MVTKLKAISTSILFVLVAILTLGNIIGFKYITNGLVSGYAIDSPLFQVILITIVGIEILRFNKLGNRRQDIIISILNIILSIILVYFLFWRLDAIA